MAVKINQKPGTGQQNLTRSLEKILEEAHCSGELSLSNRKLKDFPKPTKEYNLSDTIIAGNVLKEGKENSLGVVEKINSDGLSFTFKARF